MSSIELFYKLEKVVLGYDEYIDCTEEHQLKTLEDLKRLVEQIQRDNIFSSNEELRDI